MPVDSATMKTLMKQAKKMQSDMVKAQKALTDIIVEGTSGGRTVIIEVNGKNEVTSLKLSSEVVDKNDIEMLENLIISAFSVAQKKVAKISEDEMSKLTGGMNIE